MLKMVMIKIDENSYKATCCGSMLPPDVENVVNAIKNGTPLPEGHGRLIDADVLIDSLGASDRVIYCKAFIEEDAPTILEADKEVNADEELQ